MRSLTLAAAICAVTMFSMTGCSFKVAGPCKSIENQCCNGNCQLTVQDKCAGWITRGLQGQKPCGPLDIDCPGCQGCSTPVGFSLNLPAPMGRCSTGGCSTGGCSTGGCSTGGCSTGNCGDCGTSSGPLAGIFGAFKMPAETGDCSECQLGMPIRPKTSGFGLPCGASLRLPRPSGRSCGCDSGNCGSGDCGSQTCGSSECNECDDVQQACATDGGIFSRFGSRGFVQQAAGDCGSEGCGFGGLGLNFSQPAATCGSPGCDGGCGGRGCSLGSRLGGHMGGHMGGCGVNGCGAGGRYCSGCLAKLSGLLGPGRHPYGGSIPHSAGPAGAGQAPTYAYPYYTTRGPRDFLQSNPPSIGY